MYKINLILSLFRSHIHLSFSRSILESLANFTISIINKMIRENIRIRLSAAIKAKLSGKNAIPVNIKMNPSRAPPPAINRDFILHLNLQSFINSICNDLFDEFSHLDQICITFLQLYLIFLPAFLNEAQSFIKSNCTFVIGKHIEYDFFKYRTFFCMFNCPVNQLSTDTMTCILRLQTDTKLADMFKLFTRVLP